MRHRFELPNFNNLSGMLYCEGSLQPVAELIRGFRGADVHFKPASYGDLASFRTSSEHADFDCYPFEDGNYLFKGRVGGETSYVLNVAQELHTYLSSHGYALHLDVKDESEEVVAQVGEWSDRLMRPILSS